jgi:hypothetical protein
MLGPEIEGEIAQDVFGHSGLASAAGSTPAANTGPNFMGTGYAVTTPLHLLCGMNALTEIVHGLN